MYERVCGFEWGTELIKKDTVVVLLSTAVGIGIATIIIFFVVWIGFPADNPQESFKDALGFAGGIFGGLATFGAAIVAAHLFNDWKTQHNAQIKYSYLKDVLIFSRDNLITLAPILSKIITAGNLYLHKDEVTDLNIKEDDLDRVYASHKKVFLAFKEYNSIFKDDDSLLLFLRFDAIISETLTLILKINRTFILNSERINEISTQQYVISLPEEIKNSVTTRSRGYYMTALDLCEQIELYYDALIEHITSHRLKE